jgi:hypothetical protein
LPGAKRREKIEKNTPFSILNFFEIRISTCVSTANTCRHISPFITQKHRSMPVDQANMTDFQHTFSIISCISACQICRRARKASVLEGSSRTVTRNHSVADEVLILKRNPCTAGQKRPCNRKLQQVIENPDFSRDNVGAMTKSISTSDTTKSARRLDTDPVSQLAGPCADLR